MALVLLPPPELPRLWRTSAFVATFVALVVPSTASPVATAWTGLPGRPAARGRPARRRSGRRSSDTSAISPSVSGSSCSRRYSACRGDLPRLALAPAEHRAPVALVRRRGVPVRLSARGRPGRCRHRPGSRPTDLRRLVHDRRRLPRRGPDALRQLRPPGADGLPSGLGRPCCPGRDRPCRATGIGMGVSLVVLVFTYPATGRTAADPRALLPHPVLVDDVPRPEGPARPPRAGRPLPTHVGDERPPINVIMPAYNEEEVIVETLGSIDSAAVRYGGPVRVVPHG